MAVQCRRNKNPVDEWQFHSMWQYSPFLSPKNARSSLVDTLQPIVSSGDSAMVSAWWNGNKILWDPWWMKIHICPIQFIHILYHPSTLVSWHTSSFHSLLRRSRGNGSIKICATVNSGFIYCSAGGMKRRRRDETRPQIWVILLSHASLQRNNNIICEYHFSLEIPPLLN